MTGVHIAATTVKISSRMPLALPKCFVHAYAMAICYPLAVLDFEASSLEHDSYPIEVGVAICEHAGAPIRTWSTLIRPTGSWSVGGHWSKASQNVHGITREQLADGTSARDTMAKLNALLAPIGTALCDGGDYDRYWLARLSATAAIEPKFVLGDWDQAFSSDYAARMLANEMLASSAPPHRAEADTMRLLNAILSQAGR